MKLRQFCGVIPALMTPFDQKGNYDAGCAKEMIDWMIERGVNGFYLTGSNGYGPAMDCSDRMKAVESLVRLIDGRVPAVAHIGAVSGTMSKKMACHAKECGCTGISAVPSYYYKLSLEEMEAYYREITSSTDLPLVIYAQTNQYLPSVELFQRLAKIPHVEGLKFTGSDHYMMGRIKASLGKDFMVYSGYDEMFLSGLLSGADGLIGGTYNIMPDLVIRGVAALKQGDVIGATRDLMTANSILEILFRYGNIQSTMRECLRWMGVESGWNPTPFLPLTKQQQVELKEELHQLKEKHPVPPFALFDVV